MPVGGPSLLSSLRDLGRSSDRWEGRCTITVLALSFDDPL